MPADPMTQPGVKLALDGANPFVNTLMTPAGVVFQVGFKDERSGIVMLVTMDRLTMADYVGTLGRVLEATRGGDGNEAAGPLGGA